MTKDTSGEGLDPKADRLALRAAKAKHEKALHEARRKLEKSGADFTTYDIDNCVKAYNEALASPSVRSDYDYMQRLREIAAAPPAPQPALALIEELERALEPFANEAERMRNYADDYPYSIPTTPIVVGELRAARTALASAKRFKEGA